MHIRLSNETDLEQIKNLMQLGFGYRDYCEPFENLNGRYLVALNEYNQIIAMTGLIWSDIYKGYEIDWTTTHPAYRRKGIMHKLFERICNLTDEEIYCSCWKVPGEDNINLKSLMDYFEFKEVISPRVVWDTRYNCRKACKSCVYKQIGDYCRCSEDLYLRERIINKKEVL